MSHRGLAAVSPLRRWHHDDFDARRLAARAEAVGSTVSVILPARNEEATVGTIVSTVRERLVEAVGLVDEIVVVDSDSTDATAAVARAAGASVVVQREVLPAAGRGVGKGEAMWKGLAASGGDVVAFVDADIHDFDERFVVGLLGPLLTVPGIEFVKATYDRPLVVDGGLAPGGGRVTELMARPLLRRFWPPLATLGQPLAGEYAARREVLEAVPFVQGYGIDLGLLVDVFEAHGLDAVAEVDLDHRIHDNKPLHALGAMSEEILAVALARSGHGDGAVSQRPALARWRGREAASP